VTIDGSGFVVDVVPQPTDLSTCAMVIAAGSELSPWQPISLAEGAQITAIVAGVWAIGFLIREGKKFMTPEHG
jgi:hypothetical protein